MVIPFGLTNSSSTFQALMNKIFDDQLRKFVIMSFHDILVFSQSKEEHVARLTKVLEVLAANQLVVKLSKCAFE